MRKTLDKGNAQTRAQVLQRLRHWQTDSDLAGLREPSALDKLSPDERKGCHELWDEVGVVLRRCGNAK